MNKNKGSGNNKRATDQEIKETRDHVNGGLKER